MPGGPGAAHVPARSSEKLRPHHVRGRRGAEAEPRRLWKEWRPLPEASIRVRRCPSPALLPLQAVAGHLPSLFTPPQTKLLGAGMGAGWAAGPDPKPRQRGFRAPRIRLRTLVSCPSPGRHQLHSSSLGAQASIYSLLTVAELRVSVQTSADLPSGDPLLVLSSGC